MDENNLKKNIEGGARTKPKQKKKKSKQKKNKREGNVPDSNKERRQNDLAVSSRTDQGIEDESKSAVSAITRQEQSKLKSKSVTKAREKPKKNVKRKNITETKTCISQAFTCKN